MFEVYALLAVCTILSCQVDSQANRISCEKTIRKENTQLGYFLLFVVLFILIWFSGTRTQMNDTGSYIRSFDLRIQGSLSEIRSVNWAIGNNPLFEIYKIIIKTFISQDSQVFILLSSVIIETLMVLFLYRYSWRFGGSIYVFIAFAVYGFTMAAMKQTMATAIAVWAIPEIINKKYGKSFLLMAIAALFHPYVILLLIAIPLYDKGIWNRFVVVLLLSVVIIGFTFTRFTGLMFRITQMIGQDYEENWESASAGVGIARVLAYSIVPILSLLFQEKLSKKNQAFFDLCINMSIVAFGFSIISWFGGAVLFGRIPNYFGCFICISVPYILDVASETSEVEQTDQKSYIINSNGDHSISLLTIVVYAAYLFYYYTYYNKFFSAYGVGMWDSMYQRVSLIKLLFGGL